MRLFVGQGEAIAAEDRARRWRLEIGIKRARTCVITRFDKTDIQLAALLTDLECLVITGGGEPSPYLIDRIGNGRSDVAVLLAPAGTVATMRAIEPLFGLSRFSGVGKLERAVALLDEANVPLEF